MHWFSSGKSWANPLALYTSVALIRCISGDLRPLAVCIPSSCASRMMIRQSQARTAGINCLSPMARALSSTWIQSTIDNGAHAGWTSIVGVLGLGISSFHSLDGAVGKSKKSWTSVKYKHSRSIEMAERGRERRDSHVTYDEANLV
ncbi:hypothetical protein F4824DRAFT_445739 [Ustulina deusta]|nr:hypothetical protein F4824DRAFT_445739 [Ustulina deusta]